MENSYQNSTIAQILEAIIDELTFEGGSQSDIADIFLSILNHTEYNKETDSVIADLLVRLKAKIEGSSFDPYDGASIGRIADIIISILEETEYTEEPQSRIAELLLELKAKLEEYTELEARGAIASFITNVALPIVAGKFYLAATQEGSGDPSPVNERMIIGKTGLTVTRASVNQFDKTNIIENTWISDSTTGATAPAIGYNVSDYIPIQPNTSYYKSANGTSRGSFFDANKNPLGTTGINSGAGVITTPSNAYYVRFTVPNTYLDTFCFNYPSSDTEYHAYIAPTVYSTNWFNLLPINDKVCFGGYYESKTGLLTFTHKIIKIKDIAAANWRYSNNSGQWGNYLFFTNLDDRKKTNSGLCNIFKFVLSTEANLPNNCFILPSWGAGTYIYIRCDNVTTINDFINVYGEAQIVYELAEPYTREVNPLEIETIVGVNNFFGDGNGDSEITYLYRGTPND